MPSQRCGIKDRELPAVENHILTTEKTKPQSTRSLARKQSKHRLDYTKVEASTPQRDSETMKADHGYAFVGNIRAVQFRRKLTKGAVTKAEAKRG